MAVEGDPYQKGFWSLGIAQRHEEMIKAVIPEGKAARLLAW